VQRLFLILFLLFAMLPAEEIPSCRARKTNVTACNPYRTSFLRPNTLPKRTAELRHRVIVERKIPITERIKVRNGITLNSLISKYIKREERLYNSIGKTPGELRRSEVEHASLAAETVPPQAELEPPAKEKEQPVQEQSREVQHTEKEPIEEPRDTLHSEEKSLQTAQTHIGMLPDREVSAPLLPQEPVLPVSQATQMASTGVQKPVVSEENLSVSQSSEPVQPTEVALQKSPVVPPPETTTPKESSQTRPESTPNPPVEVAPKEKRIFAKYQVKKGDSLLKVAKRFRVDVTELAAINQLKQNALLKVGQSLHIPLSQELADTLDNAFYIVRKGDTLSGIAKRFNVKLSDLKKYNKIRKKSIIHIGQGLVLPLPHKLAELKRAEEQRKKEAERKKRERERLARIALKKAEKAKFLKISKRLRRKLSVTATAYTSHRGQTDSTPFLAAWNNRIRPGMKVIAVSRDLITKYGITNGSKVRISGLPGIYTVRDKMNKKWRRKIDIYMGTNRWKALRWGRRRVTLYY